MKYPNSITLLNFDHLTEHYPYKKEVYDFLDHILLRCYNSTGIRNHIPILLESSNGKFFSRDIYEMMSIEYENYFNIDV